MEAHETPSSSMDCTASCTDCRIHMTTIKHLNRFIASNDEPDSRQTTNASVRELEARARCGELERDKKRLEERVKQQERLMNEQQRELERLRKATARNRRNNTSPSDSVHTALTSQTTPPPPPTPVFTVYEDEKDSTYRETPRASRETSTIIQLSDADIIEDDSRRLRLGLVGEDISEWVTLHDFNIRGVYISAAGNSQNIIFPHFLASAYICELVRQAVHVSSRDPSRWPSGHLSCIASRRYHKGVLHHRDERGSRSWTACAGCTNAQRLCAYRDGDRLNIRALHPSLRTDRPGSLSFWVSDTKPTAAVMQKWVRRIG